MTIEDVKNKFKDEYTRYRLVVVDEHPDELFFRTRSGIQVKASSEDLNTYLEFTERQPDFENIPFETCLCSSSHYEQLVSSPNRYSSSLSFWRGDRLQFGNTATDQITVEIGEASSDFKNSFRFHEFFVMRTLDRLRFNRGRDNQTLSDLLYAPLTIRVVGLSESSPETASKKALELIEGCLFNLAYLKGTTLVLEEELPRNKAQGGSFQFEENDFGKELPLPKTTVNKDVARFYQRGMAAEDPVHQFLSFYQVLEYFFLAVSDEDLYRKIALLVNDPLFTTKSKHLDKVIQATLNHKRESDETEMLRMVIRKNVEELELVAFIKAYEGHLGESLYTKKRKLFGEESQINIDAKGHVIGCVSKRIKIIRNALVHSSDRHKRQENFVPTRNAEMKIRKEVPLLKYLAEKVVIASGS
jgi:hypothetical protein